MSETAIDLLALLGIPLFAAAVAIWVALRSKDPKGVGRKAFFGTWILGVILSVPIGVLLDCMNMLEHPSPKVYATMLLPALQLVISLVFGFISGMVAARLARGGS